MPVEMNLKEFSITELQTKLMALEGIKNDQELPSGVRNRAYAEHDAVYCELRNRLGVKGVARTVRTVRQAASPLHEDKELPDDFRKKAESDWPSALALAEQLLDDSMPEHIGSIWNNGHLWEWAQELAGSEPVLAAALLLVLAEQDKLLLGPMPKI